MRGECCHFPYATQIVDLLVQELKAHFHARQHLADLGKIVYGTASEKACERTAARKAELDNGAVEAVVAAMERLRTQQQKVDEEIRNANDYFQTNKDRMRYAEFRRQGLFAGS